MSDFSPAQIRGYRSVLQAVINACDNGSEVTVDLTTCRKLVEICKQTDEEIGELAAKLRGEAGASMFKNTRHEAAGYLESLLARAKDAEVSATETFQIGVRHQDVARKAESNAQA